MYDCYTKDEIPPSNLCIGKAFQAHLVKLILSAQLICFIKSDPYANEINPNHFKVIVA